MIKDLQDTNPNFKSSEQERIELAKKLGNKFQSLVQEEKTIWQQEKKGVWLKFDTYDKFFSYLYAKYGLFPRKTYDFWGRTKVNGYDESKMWKHIFEIENYPQRIPMSVLLKAEEALECGIIKLKILDPDLENTKYDPFLFGYGNNNLYLICRWEDKNV